MQGVRLAAEPGPKASQIRLPSSALEGGGAKRGARLWGWEEAEAKARAQGTVGMLTRLDFAPPPWGWSLLAHWPSQWLGVSVEVSEAVRANSAGRMAAQRAL